jgi:hypothetical protein
MRFILTLVASLSFNLTHAFDASKLNVDYFNEIALVSDFSASDDRHIRMWTQNIKVFVEGGI